MKLIIFVLFLSFNTVAFCQSQADLSMQADTDYKKADTELNDTYKQIIKKYKTDAVFIAKLKKAQLLWVQFRDAQLEMKFPAEDKQMAYGSMYMSCAANYLNELTQMRTEELKSWLTGAEEGDVCGGSIALKED